MPVTKVSTIIQRAGKILNDPDAIMWERVELQEWINESYPAIIDIRPDANPTVATVPLAAGVRQDLTDAGSINLPNASRIMDVIRCMSATSNKGPIRQSDKQAFDDTMPGWYAESETVNITNWFFDLRTPKKFMNFPPASVGAEVEILYASVPDPHALTEIQLVPGGSTEVIKIDDTYANAILDYVLYRAFKKDSEYGDPAKSAAHLNAFNATLGLKTTVDKSLTGSEGAK